MTWFFNLFKWAFYRNILKRDINKTEKHFKHRCQNTKINFILIAKRSHIKAENYYLQNFFFSDSNKVERTLWFLNLNHQKIIEVSVYDNYDQHLFDE